MIFGSPRLVLLIAIPLIINIGLYVLFFYYGATESSRLISSYMQQTQAILPAWPWLITLTRWVLSILAWLTLGLIAALTFTIVSSIVLSPFNDRISRVATVLRRKELGSSEAELRELSLSEVVRLESKRTIFLILGAITAAILGIIPLMQLPALILGAWLVAFEYFGYPVSQKSAGLLTVLKFTLRHPAISLGFGGFLLLLMALPFASVFYIPLAVVTGSILFVEIEKH